MWWCCAHLSRRLLVLVKVNFFSTLIVINGKTVNRVNFTSPLNDDAEMMLSFVACGEFATDVYWTMRSCVDFVSREDIFLVVVYISSCNANRREKNRKLVVECAGINFMTCWLNNNNISFLITSSELLIRQVHSSFAIVTRKISVLYAVLEWIHQLTIIFYLLSLIKCESHTVLPKLNESLCWQKICRCCHTPNRRQTTLNYAIDIGA